MMAGTMDSSPQNQQHHRVLLATQDTTTLAEGLVFLFILLVLMLSLNLLIKLARMYAQQRPTYTKPDPMFRNPDLHQNWNWDWVMVFRVQDAGEVVTRYQEQHSLRRVVERLNEGGLETKLFKSYHYDMIFCKIRCGLERLQDQAAAVGYPLLMKEAEVASRMSRDFRDEAGQIVWKRRRIVDEKHQCRYAYNEFIYGKYVHMTPQRDHLRGLFEEYQNSSSIFRGVDRLKLIMSVMEADIKQEGCSLLLRELVAKEACLAIYPLHDDIELHALQNEWLAYLSLPWEQPIERVKDYFGEKVGMYFLFLGHYATWLLAAGGVGLCLFLVAHWQAPGTEWAVVGMAAFTSLWSTFFLQSWKATQATAKMEWGMTGFEELERERTGFVGAPINSPVTGMPELYFPPREHLRRALASYAQVALCMLYVTTLNAGVFYAYAYVSRYPTQNSLAFSFFPKAWNLPLILVHLALAGVIHLANHRFAPFAAYLNGIENHRTDTQYEDNLIAKVFVFQFANSYGSLFYITLAQGPAPEQIGLLEPWRTRRFTCKPLCFQDAGALLGTIFLIRVVFGNIVEVVLPYLKLRGRRSDPGAGRNAVNGTDDGAAPAPTTTRDDDDSGPRRGDAAEYDDPFDASLMRKRQLSPAEEQFRKEEYDNLSLFHDYAELVIQFGYATLFVSAFPLAPMFACANNVIEVRVDGWKLTQNARRPWPAGAEDIGTWEDVLDLMGVLATISNISMVCFISPVFAQHTLVERFLIFIALETLLVGVKIWISAYVDETPEDVTIQVARQQFYEEKIILQARDEDEDDDVAGSVAASFEPPIYKSDPQIEQPGGSASNSADGPPRGGAAAKGASKDVR